MRGANHRCVVPPHPELWARWLNEYRREVPLTRGRRKEDLNAYLKRKGYVTPASTTDGMDDGYLTKPAGVERLDRPIHQPRGRVNVLALLVDFEDAHGGRAPADFEDLLFSRKTYPTGSMRDYYAETSYGAVDVQGAVHGWFRMPQPLAFYAGKKNGMGTYPNNAQKLAEDAVDAAVAAGVAFGDFDVYGNGSVTALFVVHAGRGAEVTSVASDLWSHKWTLHASRPAGGKIVDRYLTVPEDCAVGVCAHELGHLVFEFADYYDTGDPSVDDVSQGAGVWEVMAAGSWNNGGVTPAHFSALLKLFQGWIAKPRVLTKSTKRVKLRSVASTKDALFLRNPKAMAPREYFIVENRYRTGFDTALPASGLCVWHVNEDFVDENNEEYPGLKLMQADGKDELQQVISVLANRGDSGDVFPGSSRNRTFGPRTNPNSDSFSGKRTGIALRAISDPGPIMTFDVVFGR